MPDMTKSEALATIAKLQAYVEACDNPKQPPLAAGQVYRHRDGILYVTEYTDNPYRLILRNTSFETFWDWDSCFRNKAGQFTYLGTFAEVFQYVGAEIIMQYFAYSPETGFDIYNTSEEAKAAANASIESYAVDAGSHGWNDEVEAVCWGEIKGTACKTNERPPETDSDFDFICDYELTEEASQPSLWIECSERMPEVGVDVIVGGGMAFWLGTHWESRITNRAIQWEVTHWQPLPELPEVKS